MSNRRNSRHKPSLRTFSELEEDVEDQDDPIPARNASCQPSASVNGYRDYSYIDKHHDTAPDTWIAQSRLAVIAQWEPASLKSPKVDPAFCHFGGLARSAEVFRYILGCVEYWLSPGGTMREWLRLNLRLALLVAVPSGLIAPLISLLLGQLNVWVQHLTETTSKIVLFPLSALLILGLMASLVYLARTLHWLKLPLRRPRSRYNYDPESYYGE